MLARHPNRRMCCVTRNSPIALKSTFFERLPAAMRQIDQVDRKIIALLNQDGRMPSAEIARRLGGITARAVANRINALMEEGIIQVRAIVNPEALGFGVLADVFIEVEPGRVQEVSCRLADLPQISYLACATGETDIIASVRARDIQELYDFVIETLGRVPGVRHTQSYTLPLCIKENASWLPPDTPDENEGNPSAPHKA